ncbi:MAG: cation diffusion facilitator family transporter [Candidatus Thermoplasmatota archaeon]|nr:cation diffusion facilitator family transporter [Candidatus Thermoplasmatota archaeon]
MEPKLKVALVSILANVGLVSVEFAIAWVTGSLAVLADAFHSGVDLIGSILVLSGIWMALRVADRTHAYGYHRYENAAALIQFVLIAIIGVTVMYEAVRRSLVGFSVTVSNLVLGAVVATIVLDLLLFRYIARKGRILQSSALQADAYQFGTDSIAKVGVLVGIGGVYVGVPFLDILGAGAIAIAFLSIAFLMVRKNLRVLVDASPPQQLLQTLADTALAIQGVTEVHSLRGRMSGAQIFVDLVVHVAPDISLEAAHAIAHAVERAMQEKLPNVAEVIVHTEPVHHEPQLDESHPP